MIWTRISKLLDPAPNYYIFVDLFLTDVISLYHLSYYRNHNDKYIG